LDAAKARAPFCVARVDYYSKMTSMKKLALFLLAVFLVYGQAGPEPEFTKYIAAKMARYFQEDQTLFSQR
jgi:hypothetical protein